MDAFPMHPRWPREDPHRQKPQHAHGMQVGIRFLRASAPLREYTIGSTI